MGDFRWLHFSDLHVETKKVKCDSETARDRLITFLKTQDFGNRQELYVFITGDITNVADYTEEQDIWIQEFTEALGVSHDRIYWAAGNHDLYRDEFSKLIIKELRESDTLSLDELRNSQNTEERNNKYREITVERMEKYRERYKAFWGRDFTADEMEGIHQFYESEDFKLLVLNTSFTSIDDNDQGKLRIKSEELRKAVERGYRGRKDIPFFVIGHHGLAFLASEDRKYVEDIFVDKGVNIYLCGHEHAPEVRDLSSARPDIKQITCGGGTPNYYSQLTFFYGKYDSIKHGIHLEPYIYEGNRNWYRNYNFVNALDENNFFVFNGLSKNEPINCIHEKVRNCVSMQNYAWKLDRLVWQMPRQWDPNIDTVIPVYDSNAVSLPVLLLGNREGYVVFLATTISQGIANLLEQREQKYSDLYAESWIKRNWSECEKIQFLADNDAGDNDGLIICVRAEQLVGGSILEVISKWREEHPQRAVVVNVWSESPYFAVKIAQITYRYLVNNGIIASVFLAAELDTEKSLSTEEVKELGRHMVLLSGKERRGNYNEKVRELQEFRDENFDVWIALLKQFAQEGGSSDWINGYRAACHVHEHVSRWLAAVDINEFFQGDELRPHISLLKEEEMDTLIWEVSLLQKRFPCKSRKKLLEKLLEMGSESMRLLSQIWENEDKIENLYKMEYSEVARWGRVSSSKSFASAMACLRNDKIRSWILIMSNPNSMDIVAKRLMSTSLRQETELVLCQTVKQGIDPELCEEVCFIRQEVYKEKYVEETSYEKSSLN